MKKIITLLIAFLFCLPVFSADYYGSTSGGVAKDTNCNQSKYFAIGKLCQDTDDAKLYKGTGSAVVEISNVVTGLTSAANVAITGGTVSGVTFNGTTNLVDGDLRLKHYTNGVVGSHKLLNVQNSRGTAAAPTYLLFGDEIGAIAFREGTDTNTGVGDGGAGISFFADENWSSTALGTRIDYFTTPNGSTTKTKYLKIANTGDAEFVFNVTAPAFFGVLQATNSLPRIAGTAVIGDAPATLYWRPTVGNSRLFSTTNTTPAINTGTTISLGGRFRTEDNAQAAFGSIAGLKENATDKNGDGYLAFYTTKSSDARSNEWMRISSIGNIGFGTSAPAFPYHYVRSDASVKTLLYLNNTNAGINTGAALSFGNTTVNSEHAKISAIRTNAVTAADTDMVFSVYNSSAIRERLRIASSGLVTVTGDIKVTGTTGGLSRKRSEAVSDALSGASGSIAVNVPAGARILGVQLRVDTAITSGDGGTTWTAAYTNTPTTAICSVQAFTKSTKYNAIHPAYELTTDVVTITITPNSGTFSSGVVRAIVYYEALDAMADAP